MSVLQTGLPRWLYFNWLVSPPFLTQKKASTERRTHHRALEREKGVIWDQAELIELHLTQQAHGSHAHAGTGTWKAPCCLNSEHADTSIRSTASVPALICSLHLWDAFYCAIAYWMIRLSSGFIFYMFSHTQAQVIMLLCSSNLVHQRCVWTWKKKLIKNNITFMKTQNQMKSKIDTVNKH